MYENPTEQYLPKVVRHAVSLFAVGMSGVLDVLQDPTETKDDSVQADDVPTQAALLQGSLQFLQKLRHSLIEFETVTPAEYQLQSTNEP